MTASTIRYLTGDVIWKATAGWGTPLDPDECRMLADALLASPELAAIIDLAAEYDDPTGNWVAPWGGETGKEAAPEVRALLNDWRANRAEQKPTP